MIPQLILGKAMNSIRTEINCMEDKTHTSPFAQFIHSIREKLNKLKKTNTYIYYTIVICGYVITFILFVVACVYCLPLVVGLLI